MRQQIDEVLLLVFYIWIPIIVYPGALPVGAQLQNPYQHMVRFYGYPVDKDKKRKPRARPDLTLYHASSLL